MQAICDDAGITFTVGLGNFVKASDELKSNGYFCDETKVLAISVHKPLNQWLPILVHEYSHFLQYQDFLKKKSTIWKISKPAYNMFFEWLSHETDLPKKELESCCNQALTLELDCERRAINLIKKFNLPLNVEDYAQRASAYVYFYSFVKQVRKWYKIGKEPYNNKKIVHKMPKNLNGRYTVFPKKLFNLYKECV